MESTTLSEKVLADSCHDRATGDTDIFDTTPTTQTVGRLMDRYPNVDFENYLAAYAFTNNLQPFDAYGDPSTLASRWQSAHQLLFNLAINQALEPVSASGNSNEAAYLSSQGAIVMDRTFTILAQVFLSVVAALCCLLLATNSTRSSKLYDDPSSLAGILCNVSDSLKDKIGSIESGIIQKADVAKSSFFKLDQASRIERAGESQQTSSLPKSKTTKVTDDKSRNEAYPMGLRMPSQLMVASALLAVLILFGALYNKFQSRNGIALSTTNGFAQQIVLSYIPTAFSTSLEPVWVM